MKITNSSTGPNIDVTAEARFGKRSYFLMVDPATVEFDRCPNRTLRQGAEPGSERSEMDTALNIEK